MITPTVGRVVWFYPSSGQDYPGKPGPLAAHIAFVHSDRMVNLMVIDANGNPHPETRVPLVQPEDEQPGGMFCQWMPFQKVQAKLESLCANSAAAKES